MEKTAREWLMELKPEHRDLAIDNVEKLNRAPESFFSEKYKYLHTTLLGAFPWVESPQKGLFWSKIANQLIKNTYYDEEAKS
jgi:hypothetical protein